MGGGQNFFLEGVDFLGLLAYHSGAGGKHPLTHPSPITPMVVYLVHGTDHSFEVFGSMNKAIDSALEGFGDYRAELQVEDSRTVEYTGPILRAIMNDTGVLTFHSPFGSGEVSIERMQVQ